MKNGSKPGAVSWFQAALSQGGKGADIALQPPGQPARRRTREIFNKNSGATWTIYLASGAPPHPARRRSNFPVAFRKPPSQYRCARGNPPPWPRGKKDQFPGSMPAGLLAEPTIDLFHGYLLGYSPAGQQFRCEGILCGRTLADRSLIATTYGMPIISFLLS